MKIIIKDNERALLCRNGIFQKMLGPGKHPVWAFLGETIHTQTAEGKFHYPDMDLSVLRKDAALEKSIAVVDVPDDSLAVRFVDGHITEILEPGTYAYWNLIQKNTFEMLSLTDPEAACALPAPYLQHLPRCYCVQCTIGDGETGLLYYDGVFQRTLPAGRHVFWNHHTKVTFQVVDTRLMQLNISGQEILTADKVSLRVNFVCSYRVTDPVSLVGKLKDYETQLYVLTQLALRETAGRYRFDELLRQKDSIGALVLAKLQERERNFFVTFSGAGVKDIVLPGEIREIMNTVLVAEKAAQASVITRREETAATKSLLDTAKLMDENATLFKLKELEYLERICDKVGHISVDSGGGILQNLRDLMGTRG